MLGEKSLRLPWMSLLNNSFLVDNPSIIVIFEIQMRVDVYRCVIARRQCGHAGNLIEWRNW